MHKIMMFIDSIRHFAHDSAQAKAEILASVISGSAVAGTIAHKNELYAELMIRDINTLAIGLFTGILTFFVTMWLRKFYPTKKPE